MSLFNIGRLTEVFVYNGIVYGNPVFSLKTVRKIWIKFQKT